MNQESQACIEDSIGEYRCNGTGGGRALAGVQAMHAFMRVCGSCWHRQASKTFAQHLAHNDLHVSKGMVVMKQRRMSGRCTCSMAPYAASCAGGSMPEP